MLQEGESLSPWLLKTSFPFSWERAFINTIDLIGKNTNLELQLCMLITESRYLKDNIAPHELLIRWHYEPQFKKKKVNNGSREWFLKLKCLFI